MKPWNSTTKSRFCSCHDVHHWCYYESMTNDKFSDENSRPEGARFIEDPNHPTYFPPRDEGVSTVGAFWRHSDLVDALAVELQMACIKPPKSEVPQCPAFGLAAFLARGVRFMVHDHPALSAAGKAISDGNAVFIPRRLIETLSNASFPPGDNGYRAHLLTWMAQASLACARHALGMEQRRAPIAPIEPGGLDMSDVLPAELDPCNTIEFCKPSSLEAALKKAYEKGASSKAIDEFCNQVIPMGDAATMDRMRSRVVDAIGLARTHLDGAMHENFGILLELENRARISSEGTGVDSSMERQPHALPINFSAQVDCLQEFEQAAGKLDVKPYTPMPVDQINGHAFFYGADAVYSIHKHADNMLADAKTYWPALRDLINNHNVPLPDGALVHIARSGRIGGVHGVDNPGPDFNTTDILNVFVGSSNCTKDVRDTLIEGASSTLRIGGCTNKTLLHLYFRDIVAASLLGQDVWKSGRWITQLKVAQEQFVQAFRMGGDALCLNGEGGALLQNMRRYAKGAQLKDADELMVAMEFGTIECIRPFLSDLDAAQLSQALLLAARNRHALDLIPELLSVPGVRADAVDGQGRTVAHVLLDHCDQAKSNALIPVIVQLIEQGLDPHREVEGYRAGERPAGEEPLATRSVMERAISHWQAKALGARTSGPSVSRQRHRL